MYTVNKNVSRSHRERTLFECVKEATTTGKWNKSFQMGRRWKPEVVSMREELLNWQKTGQHWYMRVVCKVWKYCTDRSDKNYTMKIRPQTGSVHRNHTIKKNFLKFKLIKWNYKYLLLKNKQLEIHFDKVLLHIVILE